MSSQAQNMALIRKGGATARILDLHTLAVDPNRDPEMARLPFFQHPRLNAGFFLKHTVRKHEREYLTGDVPVATKIILPMSLQDLSMGGHSVFVEERGFEAKLRALLGDKSGSEAFDQDLARLLALAELPSFDPFLLIDRFGGSGAAEAGGRPVAAGYFNITPDEQRQMEGHVAAQMGKIVTMAFKTEAGPAADARARKFANILLSNQQNDRLSFIREALGMADTEFARGLFGWRGLLYYHWAVSSAKQSLTSFVSEFANAKIINSRPEEVAPLQQLRQSILTETRSRWTSLRSVLDQYDTEFELFQRQSNPAVLRQFLLKAPALFYNLGCDLSAVNHVASFWRFWRSGRAGADIQASEACELFPEFHASLMRFPEANYEKWVA